MTPEEVIPVTGEIVLNEGVRTVAQTAANLGNRPVQAGTIISQIPITVSVSTAILPKKCIAAGTTMRFELRQKVTLMPCDEARRVIGFNSDVMRVVR